MAVDPVIRSGICELGAPRVSKHKHARECVAGILKYIETMERAAVLRNKRELSRHWQQCWLTVWEVCYGADNLQAQEIYPTTTAAVTSDIQPRPLWFKEKYSRPLRLVVARVSRRLGDEHHGAAPVVCFDRLECGHEIESAPLLPDQKPAKHRRCRECHIESYPENTCKLTSCLPWPESSRTIHLTKKRT